MINLNDMRLVSDAQLKEIECFVKERFAYLPQELHYHTLAHTVDVVGFARILAKHENLSENETNILLTAAWFHDIGYVYNKDSHEDKSESIAFDYLRANGFNLEVTGQVIQCIDATKYPQKPLDKLAECLCDADLFHLSLPSFFVTSRLLKKELDEISILKFSKLDYWILTKNFMTEHSFKTTYGKLVLSQKKKLNLRKLKKIIRNIVSIQKLKRKRIKKSKKLQGKPTKFALSVFLTPLESFENEFIASYLSKINQ
jgi:uncharacterized protein